MNAFFFTSQNMVEFYSNVLSSVAQTAAADTGHCCLCARSGSHQTSSHENYTGSLCVKELIFKIPLLFKKTLNGSLPK